MSDDFCFGKSGFEYLDLLIDHGFKSFVDTYMYGTLGEGIIPVNYRAVAATAKHH